MINLVNNSINALEGTENKKIELSAISDEDEKVIVRVIDNGYGISKDNIIISTALTFPLVKVGSGWKVKANNK